MCEAISNVPVKWKPKMKLKCIDPSCKKINKHVVSKINKKDDMAFIIKCKICGEESYVTEDLLREMQEDVIKLGGNK